MRTLTLPSVGSQFLAATMLLLLSGHATAVEANEYTQREYRKGWTV